MAERPRRSPPHPARGEVFSARHRADPPAGPRGAPGWADRVADDAQADAEADHSDDPRTYRPTCQWPPR